MFAICIGFCGYKTLRPNAVVALYPEIHEGATRAREEGKKEDAVEEKEEGIERRVKKFRGKREDGRHTEMEGREDRRGEMRENLKEGKEIGRKGKKTGRLAEDDVV